MISVTDIEEEVDDKHLRVVVLAFKALEARHRLPTDESRMILVRCKTLEEVQASDERIVVMLMTIMT